MTDTPLFDATSAKPQHVTWNKGTESFDRGEVYEVQAEQIVAILVRPALSVERLLEQYPARGQGKRQASEKRVPKQRKRR